MNRLALAGGLVIALGVSAAYADTGFLSEAGGPQVPPYQNLRSDTTLQKQRQSGYFPTAGAPQVAPTTTGAQ